MVEAALNAAAEQVLEYSATGIVMTRDGNRSRHAAPQGVYACAGEDSWLAIAVENDGQWNALRKVLGGPAWAAAPELDTHEGRKAAHDAVDAKLRSWTATRAASEAADELCDAGVPAAEVIPSRDVVHNPQLRHRGLFEIQPHRVTGEHELTALPFRFRRVDHWLPRPAPTLGEHNDEVLTDLGLRPEEIAALRAAGIVGERPTGL